MNTKIIALLIFCLFGTIFLSSGAGKTVASVKHVACSVTAWPNSISDTQDVTFHIDSCSNLVNVFALGAIDDNLSVWDNAPRNWYGPGEWIFSDGIINPINDLPYGSYWNDGYTHDDGTHNGGYYQFQTWPHLGNDPYFTFPYDWTIKMNINQTTNLGLQFYNANTETLDTCYTRLSNNAAPTNTPPSIACIPDVILNSADTYSLSGTFADRGSTGWTANVDYGDGTGVQPIPVSGTRFELNHKYNSAGIYRLTVSVTDNDGATGVRTASISVNNPEPVTIAFSSSADTYVRSGSDNRNAGAGTFMRLQDSGDNRSLVKFDQTAMQSQIGIGQVLSAKLRVTIVDNGNNWGTTGRTIDIHRLTANWAEGNGTENNRGTGTGATWECATDSDITNRTKDCNGTTEWEMGQPNNPLVHPWAQAASDTQTITNNQSGVVEFDVTSDVVSFLDSANQNYGWIIKKTNEGQNGRVNFGTKESSSDPQLVVTYQP